MLNAIEISPKVWWVGGIDWNERLFHGYTTERGITYNAYLIMDEKVTLIDTCKATFSDELVQRISQVVDPAKIDVVITNHVEMDHSGSLPVIHRIAPNAAIYASAGAGVNEVRAHFGIEATPVKSGDTLCIGERTLTFVTTPMVHWPDNMVTYSDVDQILFSNDAFGQHFATTKRFDDENDLCEIFKQAKKYYANIVWPYGMQAHKALEAVKGLDLKMIAPSHGCIWRSHIDEILEKYEAWTTYQTEEKAVVVFDSMWHSTESMAREICDAFIAEGVSAQLVDVKTTHISDIMLYMCDAKYVAVGSPTLNSNMLPTIASFLTYMRGLSPKNEQRIGLAFGSYGWAPLGPKQVYAELENAKFQLPVPVVAQQWIPSEENLAELQDTVRKMIEAARA
ncbi:FprA family A-type flavoprotein [Collinsella stercoris]|uniref:Metallo-beta-lactamase domain protein n=1 Tax=Collinsella stercoris DSM 13279 TaxID=445975 RepID=B6GAA0_9ACTN|nr:FprA family A-type flavoprotein [Collinsella stercoris]EEA90790.1 metallo-beta-lactamase domain protein [Collinsella stercoris DSM 13279]UEA45385.1 FprA family A-type flavoprotein [Collinsella stercoris DSM 13279]UWP12090.1 FprA family A-type flavoprotein [Collinsella stercoris]